MFCKNSEDFILCNLTLGRIVVIDRCYLWPQRVCDICFISLYSEFIHIAKSSTICMSTYGGQELEIETTSMQTIA